MKKIFAAKSADPSETRTPVTPETVKALADRGLEVHAEAGIGLPSGFADPVLQEAGAAICEGNDAMADADIVLRISKPDEASIKRMKPETLHISFLDPFNERELLAKLAEKEISAISLEMIPRISLAQKMDVLSSQSSLAGYFAVIKAAETLGKVLPMMMTPAGTIPPAKIFIIGVGVAGLQAIATAKRLGAQVEAFDTRPVVEEQVKSLGAKFLKIDLGETGQTDQGYARELTPEQIKIQKEGMKKACAQADIVITTAKVFGRPAPKIVDASMVEGMHRGAVLVDLAVETGGNIEGSRCDEIVETPNGARIIGLRNMEGRVARDASRMLASNYFNLLDYLWDEKGGDLELDPDNEILKGCLITHGGSIVHEKFEASSS